MPSELGGGDLDGDLYNVTAEPTLIPRKIYEPATYDPAPRKEVDHESTMADVAEFVADYISNDVSSLQLLVEMLCDSLPVTDQDYWNHSIDVDDHRRPNRRGGFTPIMPQVVGTSQPCGGLSEEWSARPNA